MKIKHGIVLLLFGILFQAGIAQTATEIDSKAMETVSFQSMEMMATLKILDDKGRERVRQIVTSSRDFSGVDKTLIRFTSPPDIKGTSMLIYDYPSKDDDMWIYLPALRKTRRIVSSEKGKSFMGSEFSNADMSKPNSNDFTHKILKEENVQGKPCWIIESKCKDEDREDMYGYSRKISWIEKNSFLCQKIEYYDFNDQLQKVQTMNNYQKQPNGKYFAFLMEMENKQNQRKSILRIDNFQVGSDLTENQFSPTMLDK
ncbi:MAG: outer membrane lipoprotein-sorting protein [Bacteroidales bacterium]|nr:outer membrane lipoprotein-sorting protein [Bacteroidales bacterium]